MINWVDELDDILINGTSITDDLIDFAPANLSIQDKDDAIVRFSLNAAQRDFYDKVMSSDSRFHLLIKPRQPGFSTLVQAMQFHGACRKSLRAATMAHDSDTTAKLRRMAKLFYDQLPVELGITRETDNAAVTGYQPHNSEITIATAGGKAKGRGGTYNFFHGSEVAFWASPEQTIAGALQGLTKDGLCIFETTTNGAQGWVWDTVNKPGKWVIHFYPWYWVEEYQLPVDEPLELTDDELALIHRADQQGFILTDEHITWRRDKQSEVGLLFPQEYPETLAGAFLTSGNSVFGDVSHALHAPLKPDYDETHRYVAAMDWGQVDDCTACSIMDTTDDVEVELLRMNRLGWDVMLERVVTACKYWHVEAIQPERNAAGAIIHMLRDEFERQDYNTTIRPITMTNKKKHKLVSNLYRGLHSDGLQLLDDEHGTSELRTFVQKQMESGLYKYEHTDGAHDDTVIARLLAWDAASKILTG